MDQLSMSAYTRVTRFENGPVFWSTWHFIEYCEEWN